jgi:hypothetical protein
MLFLFLTWRNFPFNSARILDFACISVTMLALPCVPKVNKVTSFRKLLAVSALDEPRWGVPKNTQPLTGCRLDTFFSSIRVIV